MEITNSSRFQDSYRLILRRAKIVATIGKASDSPDILRTLIESGTNVLRLNFSHGDHKSHGKVVESARAICKEIGKPVAILGDLCGPKIRVATFLNGSIELAEGSKVAITTKSGVVGYPGVIPSQYENLIQDIKPGQIIFFDDGLIEAQVTEITPPDTAAAVIKKGGILKNNKGMNLPGARISTPALTEKDLEDLEFAIRLRLEYVGLSFVRHSNEIRDLRERIRELTRIHHPELLQNPETASLTRIIAKIEKPEALDDIDSIVDESDALMIARGDLGVEMPPERVPIVQVELIRLANEKNKPVIVATQMMESMIEHPRPTRAEVTDVASAISLGADAVMLSGETAAGLYPVESVRYMDRVIREVESNQWARSQWGQLESSTSRYPLLKSLARACTQLSRDMEIRAINVLSRSGRTARILSATRPNCPVLAFSNDQTVVNQMQLHWGLNPFRLNEQLTLESFAEVAADACKKLKIAEPSQYILLVSSPLERLGERTMSSIIIYEIQ
jgi:pyruvate kinase